MKLLNFLFILFYAIFLSTLNIAQKNSIKLDNVEFFRAIHIGGNWGVNRFSFNEPISQDYINFLDDINANWVGISVALHIENSMDSTVELKYDSVGIPTFTDENLINTIRALKANNLNIYLTLAFEIFEANNAEHHVARWQLGDTKMPQEDATINPEFWPWSLNHPSHNNFVSKFWQTYTDQAVHFAKICENEGVDIYSLGTETDRLFRTRTEGYWENNYFQELSSMVDSVRNVYNGLLTYDMHYDVLTDLDFFSPLKYLWDDLNLDIVGVSAYFPLMETQPVSVTGTDSLMIYWRRIFQDYIIPFKNLVPNKPILFLEFGYVDNIAAPHLPDNMEFSSKIFQDSNNNGLDDGEEVQANIYSAFFNVNEENNNIIKGAFLWGNEMSDNESWNNNFGILRTMSIRQKLAQEVVKNFYGKYVTSLNNSINPNSFSLSQNYPNPFNPSTTIKYSIPENTNVRIDIYNSLGQLITTLVNKNQNTGNYSVTWNGKNKYGKFVSSGTYLYKLSAENFTKTFRMLFIK